MRRPLRITELNTIRSMHAQGASTRAIADATGRSFSSAYSASLRHGFCANRTRTLLTSEQRDEIAAAYLSGESSKSLAARYRIDPSYVSRLARAK